MDSLSEWYKNMNPKQRKFVWFCSLALIMVWGVGLLPTAILIYIKLGEK